MEQKSSRPIYNFPLDSDPLNQIKELYPIDNSVVIVVSGIPINKEYAKVLSENANSLCRQFGQDLILGVYIPSYDDDVEIDERDLMSTIGNDYEDDDEHDEYDEYMDEFLDEDYDDYYDDEEVIGNTYDIGGRQVMQFMDEGFHYNFTKILPETDDFYNKTYQLADNLNGEDEGFIYSKESSIELNKHIDTNSDTWMFTFQFRHPLSLMNVVANPRFIKKDTTDFADSVMLSLMDAVSSGLSNIVKSNSMELILDTMKDIAVMNDRIPFVGTVSFNVFLDNLPDVIKSQYNNWITILYNMILEDYVDYE